jgi:ABC-type branched-subunit amino acid transport system permease subunit
MVTRTPFAWWNCLLSIGVFAIGVGTVIISGYLQNDVFFASPGNLQKFQSSMFVAILIVGLAAIAASLLGCATLRIRSKVIPITFCMLLTPIFVIFVVTSVKMQAVLQNTEDGVIGYCKTNVWAKS